MTMTPEKRAHDLMQRIRYSSLYENSERWTTESIRAAIAEEREACAKMVEAASQRPGSVAEELAAAIRART